MSAGKSGGVNTSKRLRNSLARELSALVTLMSSSSAKQDDKSPIALFTDLLRPYAVPPTPLHEILQEAAKRAGWSPPSVKSRRRQQMAAQGRAKQREEDLAIRRVLVSFIFKQLRPSQRARPGSTGTAQAIIGRLDELPLKRPLPMTVRTIQEDIRYMKENGNFGI